MLTDTKLRKALGRPIDAEEIISDSHGLNAKISKTGKISFIYRYRWRDKPVKLTIGNYPAMSIAQAREKRQTLRNWLENGFDPREKLKLQLLERTEALSVREAFEYWTERYCIPAGMVKVDYNWGIFNKHIAPVLGDVKVDNTSRENWVNLFDRMESRVMAHHMFSLCKRAFRFCLNRDVIKVNPLENLVPSDVGQKPKIKDRKLSADELRTVYDWLRFRQGAEAKFLVRFIMLTGCRTSEIRQATWDWFDLENQIWTIPATHYKTRMTIRRALSPAAVRMLQERKDSVDTRHVVTSARSFPDREKDRPLNGQVAANFAKSIRQGAKMEEWSLHDLRRTFATMMSELGCPPYVVEKLLGHQMIGVMAHYNLHDYMDDQRRWVKVWEDKLSEIMGEQFG
ncbi:site-specific integrase [Pantoea sp. At-9b]|uniref:tyrosine-type recombinase/integrase n=1 Tax=Pantoea sp. (strain At-9b) TaxID=592316 RepID=UPI0001B3F50B|nr:site-specific integrase [Pantoea sp. At-9b]ADU69479.1 integrase family protein [Pantoea sp. At-9b]